MTNPLIGSGVRPARLLPGGGGWLRILLLLAGAAVLFSLWPAGRSGGQLFMEWAGAILLTGWLVFRPASAAPAVFIFGALCVRVFVEKAQLDGNLIALVLLLPLVHQLSALAAVVPLRANVELSALWPTFLRYLGASLATVIGLLLSHWLSWW